MDHIEKLNLALQHLAEVMRVLDHQMKQLPRVWKPLYLAPPYLWITALERYWCSDSIMCIYHVENGETITLLIPYN